MRVHYTPNGYSGVVDWMALGLLGQRCTIITEPFQQWMLSDSMDVTCANCWCGIHCNPHECVYSSSSCCTKLGGLRLTVVPVTALS